MCILYTQFSLLTHVHFYQKLRGYRGTHRRAVKGLYASRLEPCLGAVYIGISESRSGLYESRCVYNRISRKRDRRAKAVHVAATAVLAPGRGGGSGAVIKAHMQPNVNLIAIEISSIRGTEG